MLTCLVPVFFTFYKQGVLKLKKNNSGAKGLIRLTGWKQMSKDVCRGSFKIYKSSLSGRNTTQCVAHRDTDLYHGQAASLRKMNRWRYSQRPKKIVTTLRRGNVLRTDKSRIRVDSECTPVNVLLFPLVHNFNTLKHIKLFKILLHVSTILSSSGSNLLPR